MKWSESFAVSPHAIDLNNIASASAVLRLMQDAAYSHMYNFPPSPEDLAAQNKCFILSKLSLSLYRPLYACEKVEAKTWACESRGYSFCRCGQVFRNGEIIAELISVWALVDFVEKKLLKMDEFNRAYGNEEILHLDVPTKIRIPKEVSLSLAGEYTAAYDDVDMNNHINNAKYLDILCGFLPSMKNKRVIRANVSYMKEAVLGEVIKIYASKEDDGTVWFRTVRRDGETNVEAEVVLENI